MTRAFVEGVGVLGPGLANWPETRAILAGSRPYEERPAAVPRAELLAAAERRRAVPAVNLALGVGAEAFAQAERNPARTATVFSASGGDGATVHDILEALASPERLVSPTRFHNSVHNAASGYWSIATGSREPTTSLCGHDESFAAGLLEAVAYLAVENAAVALVAFDLAYPEPLHSARPITGAFGVGLVLTPVPTPRSFAWLDVTLGAPRHGTASLPWAALEALRLGNPAARALPLLAALASEREAALELAYPGGSAVAVELGPVAKVGP